jgi:hypothetical protein
MVIFLVVFFIFCYQCWGYSIWEWRRRGVAAVLRASNQLCYLVSFFALCLCPHHQWTIMVQAHQDSREEDTTTPPHWLCTGTIMVQAHQDSREEDTTTPFPPQETEKFRHGSSDPQKVWPLVIDCSLCYRTASCTGMPILWPKGSWTASTPKAIRLLNN